MERWETAARRASIASLPPLVLVAILFGDAIRHILGPRFGNQWPVWFALVSPALWSTVMMLAATLWAIRRGSPVNCPARLANAGLLVLAVADIAWVPSVALWAYGESALVVRAAASVALLVASAAALGTIVGGWRAWPLRLLAWWALALGLGICLDLVDNCAILREPEWYLFAVTMLGWPVVAVAAVRFGRT